MAGLLVAKAPTNTMRSPTARSWPIDVRQVEVGDGAVVALHGEVVDAVAQVGERHSSALEEVVGDSAPNTHWGRPISPSSTTIASTEPSRWPSAGGDHR